MLRSRPGAAMAKGPKGEKRPARALVRTYRFWKRRPIGLLTFGCLVRELAPLERSHGQQGASTLGVCELGKPITLRRFAQATFTGFHVPPR
jgi:hypothetical protein